MTRPQRVPQTRRRDARALDRRQMIIGVAGIAVALVLVAISGIVYLNPFGHHEYRADFESSGGLRAGDEVRIAGIKVGQVSGVDLYPDRVQVRFEVDDDVPVGDASSADTRLLTAIGGHYLALDPAGREALADGVIPQSRTTVPYTLSDVIADSGDIVRKVDGVTISQTLTQVEAVLGGQPDAIREIISGVGDLTTAIGAKETDLDKTFALSEEYLASLDHGRADLVELLRLIGFVGANAYQVKAEGVETVKSIGALFAFIGKPVDAFTGTIEPPVAQVLSIVRQLQAQPSRIDDLLNRLRSIVTQISKAVGLPGRTPAIDASDVVVDAPGVRLSPRQVSAGGLCIPTPQRRC